MTLETVLIANRGEIACRVIRTAREMGLRTVAVYSDADRGAPHTLMADDAVRIGPAPAAESYFSAERIIEAARAAGADAIHPGYGFLSENADFAEAVMAAGLDFIGPPAAAIRAMGDKAGAKRLMSEAGVPCVPGYEGEDQSDRALTEASARIGFPVMVKASAGGGGRGMRLVAVADALPEALVRARAEARSAFGDGRLIIEKALPRPRHVEIQIFADDHGACLYLGERDCSVQRRHQKVIEEAPSPAVGPALREEMGRAAVAAARAVAYRGAGTVEFLLDANGGFYFLEMNTRLQVEHPVTEMVTGLDLVALQIRVARGEALPLTQGDVRISGAAMEARLYAEDAAAGFLPSTGMIEIWRPASGAGVRIDSGVAEGDEVSPWYDPMLAKIVTWGETRDEARRRLIHALEETALVGPVTNTDFLIDALGAPAFKAGEATTAFIEETWPAGPAAKAPVKEEWVLAAAIAFDADRAFALDRAGLVGADQLGWRSDGPARAYLTLETNGEVAALVATPIANGWRVTLGAETLSVELTGEGTARISGRRRRFAAKARAGGEVALALGAARRRFFRAAPAGKVVGAAGDGLIRTPMPGLLSEIAAELGATVAAGETLAVLEAMKMQHRIVAPVAGKVTAVRVTAGEQVTSGAPLIEIAPIE